MNVLAAVDDIFFAARIRETARHVGVPVEILPVAKLGSSWVERDAESPAAVIVDLNSTGGIELIRQLRGVEAKPFRIVGFVSHVAADRIAEARAAGCDQVMARSAFTQELPELLRRLCGEP